MIFVSTGAEVNSSGSSSRKMPHTGKVDVVAENWSGFVVSRPAEQRYHGTAWQVQFFGSPSLPPSVTVLLLVRTFAAQSLGNASLISH